MSHTFHATTIPSNDPFTDECHIGRLSDGQQLYMLDAPQGCVISSSKQEIHYGPAFILSKFLHLTHLTLQDFLYENKDY